MSGTKNIVVIGTTYAVHWTDLTHSGGGGLPLVRTLQKQINPAIHRIIVIEKRDYYAHWPALI
ncbi:hypothetical protein FRC06_006743, partial [Ceratobasidium sp. 370]